VAAAGQDLVKTYEASHSGDHKTAQSIENDRTGHGIASVLGGAPVPHGGHDDFAALIKMANNPAAFGLLDHNGNAHGAESSLNQPLHVDLAIHVQDFHVETAPVVPLTLDHHVSLPELEAFHPLHH
jgi:hypothetical protein